MRKENKNISDIIYKHLQEAALSIEEQAALDQWLAQSPANQQLLHQLSDEEEWKQYLSVRTDTDTMEKAFEQFRKAAMQATVVDTTTETHPSPAHRVHFIRKWGWAAASVIIFFLGAGAYLWTTHKKDTAPATAVVKATEIPPGKDGAILTLSDGRQVMLDSLGNGIIATQNGAQVILNNNAVTYAEVNNRNAAVVYNTLSTPKGRQFHVQLPDGTDVWLNAASSIRYPTVFAGKERNVTITGEAYFEVAKNKEKPFMVDVDGKATVEVTGTHFNVNAYADEPRINTTLLEGSVRVVNQQSEIVHLKPGQQAQLIGQKLSVINTADTDVVMAWKNGSFRFNNARLDEVLRQLSRWYDVEVIYEQTVPDIPFNGAIRRDFSLSQALLILEVMDVHFSIEGKILIVKP